MTILVDVFLCFCMSMLMLVDVYVVDVFASQNLFLPLPILVSPGEFPESVKINETVDFVGGKSHTCFILHKCHCIKSFPGDLDDDIEFDDVDSEGSGSDEGDDIDGI